MSFRQQRPDSCRHSPSAQYELQIYPIIYKESLSHPHFLSILILFNPYQSLGLEWNLTFKE